MEADRLLGGTSAGVGAPGPLEWRDWTAEGACRGIEVEEFYGLHAGGRRWCGRCPVRECCFWWALVVEAGTGEFFGIWGDASPAVREKVAKVVGIAAARARLVDALSQWAAGSSAVVGVGGRKAG